MTSQTLMSNPSSTLSRSQSTVSTSGRASSPALSTSSARWAESMKSVYQADQQVKLLHLQAEVESLLLQLQTIKQQRLITTPQADANQDGGSNSN